MGLLFGLLTAVSIGTSDLFGRRVLAVHGALTTGVGVQFVAIAASLVGVLLIPSAFSLSGLSFGLMSGIGMGVGLWGYLGGLERSSSAIIAPLVATLSAVIPYGYAVVRGASPTPLAMVGALIALVGIVIITVGGAGPIDFGDGFRWGLVSGLGYGVGLSVVLEATEAAGAWPAVGQRLSAFVMLAVLAKRTSSAIRPTAELRPWVIAAGVFAALSTIFYLVGLEFDATSTVITASLFPAMSVLVGRTVYADEVAPRQIVGLGVALIGMIGVGIG